MWLASTIRRLALLVLLGLMPHPAWALTSGPAQPEFRAFTGGSTEIVDPFTGDLVYTIPLMEIPAPGGSYPLLLSYRSGITMEQEASWVGLGWSLSTNVISRQVRGLPDDFHGSEDLVGTKRHLKPQKTVGATLNLGFELFGFDTSVGNLSASANAGVKIMHDSYRGLGMTFVHGLSADLATSWGLAGGLDLSFDGREGLTATPSLAISRTFGSGENRHDAGFGISTSLSSLQGIKEVSFEGAIDDKSAGVSIDSDSRTAEAGVGRVHLGTTSYAKVPGIPTPGTLYEGFSVSGSLKGGIELFGTHPNLTGGIFYNYQNIKDRDVQTPAYGALYLEDAGNNAVLDFLREQDGPIYDDAPNLAVPVLTTDLYHASGEGLAGTFRAFRNDIPVLFDARQESTLRGVSIDGEIGAGNLIHTGFTAGVSTSSTVAAQWGKSNDTGNLFDQALSDIDRNLCASCERFHFKFIHEAAAYHPVLTKQSGTAVDLAALAPLRPKLVDATTTVTDAIPGTDWLPTKSADSKLANDSGASHALTDFALNSSRANRATLIQSFTNGQIRRYAQALPELKVDVPITRKSDHHIGGFIITKPDGTRYVYAIPVYNHVHEEYHFAASRSRVTPAWNCVIADPDESGGSYSHNPSGSDNFLLKKTMPPYVTAYLLTAILGKDYVDVGSDGVSDDDLGFWVKFTYRQANDPAAGEGGLYRWRTPFKGAGFERGIDNTSTNRNDRFSYTYGGRDLWYLTRIDTKTHYALFNTSDRPDAVGAAARVQQLASATQGAIRTKALNEIALYKKNGTDIPLQAIHFRFDHRLAPGVANFSALSGTDPAKGSGKLTLRSLSTTFKESTKGDKHPHTFQYAGEDPADRSTVNPPYDPTLQDAWGHYRPIAALANNVTASQTIPANAPHTIVLAPPAGSSWGMDRGVRNASGVLKRVSGTPATNEYAESNGTYTFASADAAVSVQIDYQVVGQFSDCMAASTAAANRPTTPQAADEANRAASAWNLTRIVEPSGRSIAVTYESDDYAFVQERSAMRLMSLALPNPAGTSCSGGACMTIASENDLIYVKLDGPMSVADFRRQLPGRESAATEDDYLYFKIRVNLCEHNDSCYRGVPAWEYVTGYAKVTNSGVQWVCPSAASTCADSAKQYYGWIQLEPDTGSVTSGDSIKHPFERAARQYLRLQRPDLILPDDPPFGDGEITSASDAAAEALSALLLSTRVPEFIGAVRLSNRGKQIDVANSWIRLKVPAGIKYGGGGRVRRVSFADEWSASSGEPSSTLGFVYTYKLEDGRSSGVATYEPTGIQEENPIRAPKPFSRRMNIGSDYKLFFQMPANESYFPGPSVGYSRVLAWTLASVEAPRAAGRKAHVVGPRLYEFHTAKDYPARSQDVERDAGQNPWLTRRIPIPLIGMITLTSKTFSQGYGITVNDMHGKPKAVRKFALNSDYSLSPDPVESVEYVYYDRPTYRPEWVEHDLLGSVSTLSTSFGISPPATETVIVGQDSEWFVDMRSSRSETWDGGATFNLDQMQIGPFPVPVPSGLPKVNYSLREVRTAVLNTVTHRTGLVKQVINTRDRSRLVTENVHFEPDAAQPIVTRNENVYGGYTYNTKLPAHWSYPGMGSAAFNAGLAFEAESVTLPTELGYFNALVNPAPAPGWVGPGDEFVVRTPDGSVRATALSDEKGWITFKAEVPVAEIANGFFLVRSRQRNLLDARKGELRTLSDPASGSMVADTCGATVMFPCGDAYQRVVTRTVEESAGALIGRLAGADVARPSQTKTTKRRTAVSECFESPAPARDQQGFVWRLPKISEGRARAVCSIAIVDAAGKPLQPAAIASISEPRVSATAPAQSRDLVRRGLKFTGIAVRASARPTTSGGSDNSAEIEAFVLANFDGWVQVEEQIQRTTGKLCSKLLPAKNRFQLPNTVDARATTWVEDWSENQVGELQFPPASAAGLAAAYEFRSKWGKGITGNWHARDEYIFAAARQRADPINPQGDGTFADFRLFDWSAPDPSQCRSDWRLTRRVMQYNRYGAESEGADIRDIRSSALFGHRRTLPIAISLDAALSEIGFEGFEEYGPNSVVTADEMPSGQISFFSKPGSLAALHYKSIVDVIIGPAMARIIPEASNTGVSRAGRYPVVFARGGSPVQFDLLSTAGCHSPGPDPTFLGTQRFTITHVNPSEGLMFLGPEGPPGGSAPPPPGMPNEFCFGRGVVVEEVTPTFVGSVSDVSISTSKAHSGKRSLVVRKDVVFEQRYLSLRADQAYVFSGWISRDNASVGTYAASPGSPAVGFSIRFAPATSKPDVPCPPMGPVIEGWQRAECLFSIPSGTQTAISLGISTGGKALYVDDLRISPVHARTETYVYDPLDLRLAAKLNEHNYSTQYGYDDDGTLDSVRRETAQGLVTVRESRQHLRQRATP